jgi:hypothetical protein
MYMVQRCPLFIIGIYDHNMKFIDIYVGMPGRVHDARVFRNSPIYDELLTTILYLMIFI